MGLPRRALVIAPCVAFLLAACGSAPVTIGTGGNGSTTVTSAAGGNGGSGLADAGTMDASTGGTGGGGMDGGPDADSGAPPVDTIDSNRDRLLGTYLDYLKASVTTPQSNGLSGSNVSSVCELWQKLDPSSQATFLTLTARMQGSKLGTDGSSMLWHITRVYRIAGGEGATATDPGKCGGDGNRMIMSMDAQLHAAQLAAHDHEGALQGNGKYDISDIPSGGFWRDTHDLAGPHDPFDRSDETEDGAPRGQTQYFADPASSLANAPLGKVDVETLVDPYALEFDQDYDCIHNSNPICEYITYGPFYLPMTSALGTAIYQQKYGDYGAGWKPSGCGN